LVQDMQRVKFLSWDGRPLAGETPPNTLAGETRAQKTRKRGPVACRPSLTGYDGL
jgi:hypothetical protein